MKKIVCYFVIVLVALTSPAMAQAAPHSAAVSWTAPADANATTNYNVYRLNSTCPISGIGTATWTKVASSLTVVNFTDTTITVGNWCYYVTQVTNGIESAPGTTAGGQAKPGVVNFSVTIS